MSDGRLFTDYRSHSIVATDWIQTIHQKHPNMIKNDDDFRVFLSGNADVILKTEQDFLKRNKKCQCHFENT